MRDERRTRSSATASLAQLGRGGLRLDAPAGGDARVSAPVSHWMIDAIVPQPGERVSSWRRAWETGMLAAELVAPVGGLIVSDQAEAMLGGARERAPARL